MEYLQYHLLYNFYLAVQQRIETVATDSTLLWELLIKDLYTFYTHLPIFHKRGIYSNKIRTEHLQNALLFEFR